MADPKDPKPGEVGYPPVKFKFRAHFTGGGIQGEVEFQEISGLVQEFGEETIPEGGVWDRVHKVPTGMKYPSDLTLKRGMVKDSSLRKWLKKATEEFIFQPINVAIHLLDAENKPLMTWVVHNAWPKKWEADSFSAMENAVAVETLVLAYSWIDAKQ
ncbi:MAG: phage tail protein [Bacteroidia bacterium]|nr:phage tail protein [Bacteroidia bacterium]